jgi:hypothetical protein
MKKTMLHFVIAVFMITAITAMLRLKAPVKVCGSGNNLTFVGKKDDQLPQGVQASSCRVRDIKMSSYFVLKGRVK